MTHEQHEEVESNSAPWAHTGRPTVYALEATLGKAIPILDHGFIRVVDYLGDDNAVVQAARVSYGKGTKKVSEDVALIRYLMKNRHSTPFEMCEIKFHVKLPIFVARQWVRHRTASINEVSARYSVLDREFYIPDAEHLAAQATSSRQGRGEVLGEEEASNVMDMLRLDATKCYDHYCVMLNDDGNGNQLQGQNKGLARELARMNLTLNTYTQWYWKTNLHNLLSFLSLRADSHAQYEIRVYAEAMLNVVKAWVPACYDAFLEYRLGAKTFSAGMLKVLRAGVRGEFITREESGLSQREWNELADTLFGKDET